MICENCRHEIGPEEDWCPVCGAENKFAKRHQQNMRRYTTAYGNTREEVLGSAQKTKGLATRAAILIVLSIGCIIMGVITSLNYASPDPRRAVRRDAEQNAAAYASEAEEFLRRGEYTEYMSFLYAHELTYSPPEEFDPLKRVTYIASAYYECIRHMEEIILRSTDPDYFDGLDSDIRSFCMYLESFYEVMNIQKGDEKNGEYLAFIEDMETELKAAMKTYFSMNDDELAEFLSLTEAKKAVRLEAVLRHE